MFIKNWMRKDVLTISSDMNASIAMKLLEENKLPFIPVVDNGVLRGILTRRDIRGAASAVTATQDVHEMNFFNKRVKVKDLMVRKPLTVSMNDTIETALDIGSEMGRSFFPVIDGDTVVGTVCDRDFKNALYQILGVGEGLCGITLEEDSLTAETLADIVNLAGRTGALVRSLFTLKDPSNGKRRLLLRFETQDINPMVEALREKGFHIMEINSAQ
jgi:acetoin utilization protein AcuB